VIGGFVYPWQSVFQSRIVDDDFQEPLRLRVATHVDLRHGYGDER